jgi:hypothetical protein
MGKKRNAGGLWVRLPLALTLVVVLLGGTAAAGASAGGPYELSWSTIDGGGSTFSAGGPYTLGGTAGQPDPGVMAGGGYTLAGGFWPGGPLPWRLYLPLILRSDA